MDTNMEVSQRTIIRNQFLASKLEVLSKGSFAPPAQAFAQPPTAPAGSGSFIWVLEHDGVPGHWERARADGQDPNRKIVENSDSVFKIVAVKCRRIPRKPIAISTGSPSDSASASGDNAASTDTGASSADQTTTET